MAPAKWRVAPPAPVIACGVRQPIPEAQAWQRRRMPGHQGRLCCRRHSKFGHDRLQDPQRDGMLRRSSPSRVRSPGKADQKRERVPRTEKVMTSRYEEVRAHAAADPERFWAEAAGEI